MDSSQETREMKWMNCSDALAAGSAKKDLERGLKPLKSYFYGLLDFAELVLVVEELQRVYYFVHHEDGVFSWVVLL